MPELKPCPFCGNEYPLTEHRKSTDVYLIRCPQCQIYFMNDCTAGHNRNKQKTIEAWNRRTNNATD